MLCEFQVYSKLFQLNTFIYLFFFRLFSHISHHRILSRVPCAVLLRGFLGGSDGKETACKTGGVGLIPGLGRSLEEGMATYSSILTWRISDRGGWRWGCKESDLTEGLSTALQHTTILLYCSVNMLIPNS